MSTLHSQRGLGGRRKKKERGHQKNHDKGPEQDEGLEKKEERLAVILTRVHTLIKEK